MSKIKYIFAALLAMGLASCDNFDLPNPPGQSNEDQPVFKDTDLVVDMVENTPIDLRKANSENVNIPLATIKEFKNFPAGYELVIEMEIGADDSFSKYSAVRTEINDNNVSINPDAFNGGIQAALTKKPGTYNLPVRLTAYAEMGTTKIRIGGKDVYYGQDLLKVTTLDPSKEIEEGYYLVTSAMGWDITKAIPMTKTAGEDVSAYDSPQFAVKINVTEEEANAGYSFKILPKSSYDAKIWDNALGCRPGETEYAGKLVEATSTNAGKISLVGPVLITADFSTDAYSVNYAFNQIWAFTSVSNAWPLYTNDYITYEGVANITTVMRLGQEPNLQGILYEEVEGSRVEEGEGIFKGSLELKKGSGIKSNLKGNYLYWVNVNLPALTYSVHVIKTLAIVGDASDWKLENAVEFTPSKDKKTWTAKGVKVGSMIQLVANGTWDFKMSGDINSSITDETVYNITAEFGQKSMDVATPGTYDVEVNFGVYPYTLTLK